MKNQNSNFVLSEQALYLIFHDCKHLSFSNDLLCIQHIRKEVCWVWPRFTC